MRLILLNVDGNPLAIEIHMSISKQRQWLRAILTVYILVVVTPIWATTCHEMLLADNDILAEFSDKFPSFKFRPQFNKKIHYDVHEITTNNKTIPIYYANSTSVVETPNTLTPDERAIVSKTIQSKRHFGIIGPYLKRISYNQHHLKALKKDYGKTIGLKIFYRIQFVLEQINNQLPPTERLVLDQIAIHLHKAVITPIHRHGSAKITLALNETGRLTKIERLPDQENNGGMQALFTDGVLHEPNFDGPEERFFIFAEFVVQDPSALPPSPL